MSNEVRYQAALEKIARTPCGLPGHAVAVGCSSAWEARMALDPDCHEECRECSGLGEVPIPEAYRPYEMKDSIKVYVGHDTMTCRWCRGTGRQLKDVSVP